MIAALIVGIAGLAFGPVDRSPSLSTCGLPERVVLDIGELPESVRRGLDRHLPGLAVRDANFQRSDNVEEPGLPRKRFVGALRRGGTWVVVYEHGVVNHLHALSFVARGTSSTGRSFDLVPNGNLVGPMCAITTASLSGVLAADPGHF